jgi:hypothetical protein
MISANVPAIEPARDLTQLFIALADQQLSAHHGPNQSSLRSAKALHGHDAEQPPFVVTPPETGRSFLMRCSAGKNAPIDRVPKRLGNDDPLITQTVVRREKISSSRRRA